MIATVPAVTPAAIARTGAQAATIRATTAIRVKFRISGSVLVGFIDQMRDSHPKAR